MEGDKILKHLPSVHNLLVGKSLAPSLWKQIEEDLEALSWLEKKNPVDLDRIKMFVSILDNSATAKLNSEYHFDIYSLPRVKIFIYDSIYQLISNKEKLKEVCILIQSMLNKLKIFKNVSSLIENSKDDDINIQFRFANSTYKSFKNDFTSVFQMMEKCIQTEYNKSSSNLLDEIFYSESLKANKEKLKNDVESHHMLRIYKTAQYQNIKFSYYSITKFDDTYVGQTEGSSRQGYGKLYYSNRSIYEGFWKNDKKHGNGIFMWKDGSKYCGQFKLGVFHGCGRRIYSNGSYYDGEFVKGKKCGKGFMKFRNGDTYEGEWDDDDMHGRGVYRWKTGDVFVGKFERDKRNGEGILTMNSGEVVSGTWEKGSQKVNEVKLTNEI